MQATPLDIPSVILLTPRVFVDERGFFYESFNQKIFDEAVGRSVRFVQDNHSKSAKGVLRGLHFQLAPKEQGKLVRVISGEVFDVAVDIRRDSPTYRHWVAAILSERNHAQLWVPEGFAHGFLVLSDAAEVVYKTTEYYAPSCDRSVCWHDPALGIHWPDLGIEYRLSSKDATAQTLAEVAH